MDFLRDESGASMVEYGLLLALIAVVCVLAVTAVGSLVKAAFEAIEKALAEVVK